MLKSKNICFNTVLSAVLFVCVTIGCQTAQGNSADISPEDNGGFIKTLDKDADGVVSKEEFVGPDKAFISLDKNQDGFIDPSEAPKMQPTDQMTGKSGKMPRMKGQMKRNGDFIHDLDKNGDSVVSREEFPGPDKAFETMDKNQDGSIDASEAPKSQPSIPPDLGKSGQMSGMQGQMKGSGNLIQDLDKDLDGKVSRDEFPGPDPFFEKMDANQDGFIDDTEAPSGEASQKTLNELPSLLNGNLTAPCLSKNLTLVTIRSS